MAPKAGGDSAKVNSAVYKDKSKPTDIRLSNINAAKGTKTSVPFFRKLLQIRLLQYIEPIGI